MNTNTKLASLENKAAAADRLVESACERRRLQHDLLEQLRIEKTDIAKSLDLVRQREIELRRRQDSFTTLHRNTARLLHQAEQGVQQFRKESSTGKGSGTSQSFAKAANPEGVQERTGTRTRSQNPPSRSQWIRSV